MPVPYQFNFGNTNDPLLNYDERDYQKDLDNQIARLKRLKEQMSVPREQPQAPQKDLWADIDREVSSLTDEQKAILSNDDVYISIENELNILIQQELINSVKYKVANTPRGKELLERHIANLKAKKENIIKESNKEMELFKKFQIAAQSNPQLTYAEFIKSLNK